MSIRTAEDTAPPSMPPRRPMLPPGVRAVRRDDRHLQVGVGARRLLVPDSPEHRSVLSGLDGRAPAPATPVAEALVARLDAAGLLVDGEEFWAAQRAQGAVATAAYAEDPTNAGAHLKRRAEARVHIVAPEPWGTLTRSLLAGAGIAEGDQAEASLSLVVSAGPLPRACHLDLLRADRPHLSVRVVEGVVTLGPFADPGRTACHRCVEVHLAETDPRRLLVLEQYADPRAGRLVPEPVDATLMTLALAWAARDIATWVEGREPATWSAIVPLTSRLEATPRRFPRHPHCGCGWGDALAAG